MMIGWLVILGVIVAYIFLIIFSEKVYKIYKFILGVFLKILNVIKLFFKVIKSIFFNLNVIFKYLIYSVLTLIFLVFITNFTEFLIIFLKNFIIGLKESFSNSTREGKFYYISLYIILIYVFINSKKISLIIYRYIEIFKNKYFYSKDKESVEKYRNIILFLGVYFSICLVGLSFYQLNGNDWNKNNKADIINIFIWATYLITPIVAIWVFSDWRIQKEYEVNKETSLSLLTVILEMENCLEELMAVATEFRCLKNDDEHIYFGKKCDALSLRFIDLINKLKSNNNLHHGLVKGFKGDKIITLENFNNIDSFFQSLCDMVFDIDHNYKLGIKSKNIADNLLKNKIEEVGKNQVLYRDSFSPIKELLSEECQPHRKAP
ncbi:hypothetical protein ABFW07_10435 [Acinetobacter soli]|uniref:hypothetical protein n=1 Tax=Acinetobacter soli TaxID=487316 RepID=UPI0032187A01